MRLSFLLLFFISQLFSYDISQLVKPTPLLDSIQNVHKIQVQAFDQDALYSDEAVQKVLEENQDFLQNILLSIKEDPYSGGFILQEAFQERIFFLKSRISINLKQGNDFAVKRDEIALGYLEQMQFLNDYILSLSYMVQSYANSNEIKDFAISQRKEHPAVNKEKFTEIYKSILKDKNPLAEAAKENFKAYITISETCNKLLEYTIQNPKLLTQITIFTLINYDDIISSVNAYTPARWLNKKISFLYLNSGKLVSFVITFILLVLSLILSKWILNFELLNFKHYQNKKLLQPIRILLLVTALDYFVLTLMYPLQPSGFGASFIIFAYILSISYLSMEFIAYLVIGYFETKQSSQNEKALISLSIDMLKSMLAIAGFVFFLNKMGVSLQTVLTSLGIFGIGIALAAKDSIANFFGSLNLLLDNTFSQGDFISIGTLEGEVVKVGLRSTQIRAFDNSLIIMPNAEAALKPVVNWSKRLLGKEIKTNIAVPYTTDPQKLKDVIDEIRYMISLHPDLVQNDDIIEYENILAAEAFVSARQLLGLKKDRFVYLDKFDSSHLTILVQTFTRTTNREEWYKVKEELLYTIWEILRKHKVDFALPAQNLFFKNKTEM